MDEMLARRHGHVAGHIVGPRIGRKVARVATPITPVVEVRVVEEVVQEVVQGVVQEVVQEAVQEAVQEEPVKRAWSLIPSRIVGRASSSTGSDDTPCSSSNASNTCEKPMGTSVATEISIGIL